MTQRLSLAGFEEASCHVVSASREHHMEVVSLQQPATNKRPPGQEHVKDWGLPTTRAARNNPFPQNQASDDTKASADDLIGSFKTLNQWTGLNHI